MNSSKASDSCSCRKNRIREKMRQFFLPEDYKGSRTLLLKGEDHHYLTRVLRYGEDKEFPGRDRDGNLYNLKMVEAGQESCLLSVEPDTTDTTRSGNESENPIPWITVYPAILKGKKFDQVIRQATETGVNSIQPLITRNTVVKVSAGDDEKKRERWQKIALEASQQCGNPAITAISAPLALKNLSLPEEDCILFFHEKMLENKPLHRYLREIPGRLHLFFGPEGGFSPEETKRFLSAGGKPVYLGSNVLRAETAVIYGTGAVQTILREHDRW
ncbi:MAG: 16S rRNA (uracil(1498)-N(3))-methyltransferase [Spirochaetales bacterium]|nr:16S rRNA (uracil(1498)-N(3))-methyltransferase [Spirochaetales bacterium]